MISKQEIFNVANRLNLPHITVEKDYILGWLLAGIYQHPKLKEILVFKGGTCLKKCFFEEYRFSEDLDFTLLDSEWLSKDQLYLALEEVAAWIYEQSGIELPKRYFQVEVYTNPRGHEAVKGGIKYRGPLAQKTNYPRIKIDITKVEILATDPITMSIRHPYSDELSGQGQALTYSFEEIFAEKIRALAQRARPRDLFDVIHLNQQQIYKTDQQKIKEILLQKCKFANVAYPTIQSIQKDNKREMLNDAWDIMLRHQLSNLKPVEHYWQQLEEVLGWLAG